MKVTKIQQQAKRTDRYSVYLDDVYSFSLSDYQLVGSGIRVGKEFSQTELDDFLQESAFGKAYERTLNYVMIRPRSQREIEEYLRRTFLYPKPKMYTNKKGERVFKKTVVDKPKTETMIQRVLERLDSKGYINDQVFARAWVRSRQLTKPLSQRKLQQELRNKGIDADIIATILQNEENSEINNLQTIIAKKRRLPRYQDDTKLTHYLLRQGFNYDDIKEAL